jgi:hypothetical protein
MSFTNSKMVSNLFCRSKRKVALSHWIIVLSVLSYCTIFIAVYHHLQSFSALLHTRSAVGNQVTAPDLYGIGVRIGLYLQGVSSIIHGFRIHEFVPSGTSLLLTTSNLFAILVSLLKLLAARTISPAESLVTLSMVGSVIAGCVNGASTIDVRGTGLGVLFFMVCSGMSMSIQTWLYSRGRLVLPLLGTANTTWFFVEVQLNDWFWKVGLAFSCLGLVVNFASQFFWGTQLAATTKWWWSSDNGDMEIDVLGHDLK